jgi:hypothetical protein
VKRSRVSKERLRFERETLRKLAAAGATPAHLAQCKHLLVKGRKTSGESYRDALQRASVERAGIEWNLRMLAGDQIDTIIFRLREVPGVTVNG